MEGLELQIPEKKSKKTKSEKIHNKTKKGHTEAADTQFGEAFTDSDFGFAEIQKATAGHTEVEALEPREALPEPDLGLAERQVDQAQQGQTKGLSREQEEKCWKKGAQAGETNQHTPGQ